MQELFDRKVKQYGQITIILNWSAIMGAGTFNESVELVNLSQAILSGTFLFVLISRP